MIRNSKEYLKYIGPVIKILRKETKKFINPIVTEIGEDTRSPFMVLISCLLSLRTQDRTTGPVAKRLFDAANTPQQIARMPVKKLREIIRPVNYYITKSNRIKEISRTILGKYNGKVPDTFDELMKLKGVGRKTANIVMTYGFFKTDYIAVDTHVHRIPNRLGWVKTRNPHQTEEELKKIIPKKYWKDINDFFVAFGQNICRPIGPKCGICPISKYCPRIGVAKSG